MRAAVILLAAAVATLGVGCGNEYTIQLQLQSDPPVEPELGRGTAQMVEGTAIGVLARAFDEDEPEDEDEPIDLLSSDSGIVDVRPGLELNQYILVARRPGTTTIEAFVDGDEATPIEVRVVAQTPPTDP
jgi:hypothetical protein